MICALGVPVPVHRIVMVSPALAVTSFRSTNTDGGTVGCKYIKKKQQLSCQVKDKGTVSFVLNFKECLTGCFFITDYLRSNFLLGLPSTVLKVPLLFSSKRGDVTKKNIL